MRRETFLTFTNVRDVVIEAIQTETNIAIWLNYGGIINYISNIN